MEIERIAAARATDQAMAAWAAAVEAINAEPAEAPSATAPLNAVGDAAVAPSGTPHQVERSVPLSEPVLPGIDADAGHEAATVQTTWRAPTPPAEVPRSHE